MDRAGHETETETTTETATETSTDCIEPDVASRLVALAPLVAQPSAPSPLVVVMLPPVPRAKSISPPP